MSERTCSIEGCESTHKIKRGLCHNHYQQAWRAGRIGPRIDPATRFWVKVDRTDPDACWPWMGYRNVKGYGTFWFAGAHIIASRMAWQLSFGSIPDGLLVCHHCDNPPCVNPTHLFLGTDLDNTADRIAKGRVFTRTHCKHGHEFTPENTAYTPDGYKRCRTCSRLNAEEYRRKRWARA